MNRRRILVATSDPIGERMAGPGIRAWRISGELSAEHEVRLVTTSTCDIATDEFDCRSVDPDGLDKSVGWAEVIIFQGYLLAFSPAMQATKAILVSDIYDPFHLENLEMSRDLDFKDRLHICHSSTQVVNQQLARSDYFLCASAKQRDFWLGQLAGVGRINLATYDASENMNSLLGIVPFGVDEGKPIKNREVLRGVVPGINKKDLILLWGGGIYDWLDPLTLIKAVALAAKTLPSIRLFFLGMKHPNPDITEMQISLDTRALSFELNLTGKYVFFNEDWVPYEQRGDYLLEADLAVSTHLDHVETEFSFRTRLLDCFWAGLPIVATSGDSLASDIDAYGAGRTVPAGDIDALAAAIIELGSDEPARRRAAEASSRLADNYRWPTVLKPLLEFCRNPQVAPDRINPAILRTIASFEVPKPPRFLVLIRIRNAIKIVIRGDFYSLRKRLRQYLIKK